MKLRNPINRPLHTWAAATVIAASFALPSAWSLAQGQTVQERYTQERAECMNGNTSQTKANCLNEANRARTAGRMGQLTTPSEQDVQQNTMARCERVPADAQDQCMRIARGEGEREGSVAEGGVLMWLADGQLQASTTLPE